MDKCIRCRSGKMQRVRSPAALPAQLCSDSVEPVKEGLDPLLND
jgi:hypothetical protein